MQQLKIKDIELGELLGQGALGKVYSALLKTFNYIVALKLLRNGEYKEGNHHWLEREIIFQHCVCHENILQVHNKFHDNNFVYIITECAPGTGSSMRDLLERNGALSEQLCYAQFISDLSKAIHHCHINGVACIDIKPKNFLLGFDGRSIIAHFWLLSRYS